MSNPLVGTWRRVSWENRAADGRVSHPLGEDPIGFILYTEDGYMAVAIMRSGRAPFAADDLLAGSSEEKARAAETFVSYVGRYEYQAATPCSTTSS
jgi:Lipocalin-like domain